MTRIQIVTILAVASLLAACASQPPRKKPQTATVQQQVAAIAAHLPQYKKIVGQWQKGPVSSTYQAFFDHGALEYLVETAGGDGAQGYAVNKYYYHDGELFYFRGQGSAAKPDVFNPHPVEIGVQLAFDDSGRLMRSRKTLNGRKVQLSPGELKTIRTHARALSQQAKADLAHQ